MNTDLDLNFLSFAGPNGGTAPRPGSLALLMRLLAGAFREMWAGHVRNCDRAGGLPPAL